MGGIGTDVAKEAADIVIMDDNFATIVTAIEQGRTIYANILKVVKFLMSGNLSEIGLIVITALLGYPTPLLPSQLLWINFVTDGLPALSLAADHGSKNLMSVGPRKKEETILSGSMMKSILVFGTAVAAVTIVAFIVIFHLKGLEAARTVTFSLAVVAQMGLVFLIRKGSSVYSNKYLLLSVALVITMQVLINIVPPLQKVFRIG